MKNLVALALVALLASSQVGCAAWWQNAKNDPVTAAHQIENGISFSVSVAIAAFGEYQVLAAPVPPATVAEFNRLVGAIADGEVVASDAINAAITAAGPAPNLAVLFAQAQSAVADLLRFLADLGVQVPGSSPIPAPAHAYYARTPLMQRAIAALTAASRSGSSPSPQP